MPNHVFHRVIVTGPVEDVQKFKTDCIRIMWGKKWDGTPESWKGFDFNAIIPMPTILQGSEASTTAEIGVQLIHWRGERSAPFEDRTTALHLHYQRIRESLGLQTAHISDVAKAYLEQEPHIEELGRSRIQALLETGFTDWYSWSVANWGTKWGAYAYELVSDDPLHFTFQTAWDFATPVWEKIVEMYPTLTFDLGVWEEGQFFGGRGKLGAEAGDQPLELTTEALTDELYQYVFGEPRPHYDEDEDEEEEIDV